MNKIALTVITVLAVSGLLLSASASKPAPIVLGGSSWTLVSYGPAASQTPVSSGIDTSVVFGTDGKVSVRLGCNYFSGSYVSDPQKLIQHSC